MAGSQVVAVVGAGVIGQSWAALFAANGYRVRVCDPRPGLADEIAESVRSAAAALSADADDLLARIEVSEDVAACVTGAAVIQENGPERIDVKRAVFADIEAAADPDALLLSSTSGLLPSELARDLAHPQRFSVAHPFNPPHVLPLVEVVPGPRTSDQTVTRTVEFYRELGREPVVLAKEVPGFVGNRLQSALFREAVSLVQDGVISAEDLDTVVTSALGPRWAVAGPFESFHLGGGAGGLRAFFDHLGPGMARRWQDLGTPSLDADTMAALSESAEKRFSALDYGDHTLRRDAAQAAVVRARTTRPTTARIDQLLGDFYGYEYLLTSEDQDIVLRTREFMEREVRPIANQQWSAAEFPMDVIPKFGELNIVGIGYDRPGRPGSSRMLTGFLSAELSRVDPSMATFYGVHSGLAMGSIALCASDEQKARWLPDMYALRKVGAFALTEKDGGSDVAGGMRTTARREGDEWVLNGAKRWIGNGTFADLVIVWARDEADDQVKGFVVEKGTPGFRASKMEGKLTLRTVQNADIELTDCRVSESNRLPLARSFKDTGRVLRMTRGGVAWSAVGCMMGAYEAAVSYAGERVQFGKPIASFQLVQDHLVTMLGNLTSSLGMAVRVAQLQDEHRCRDEQAALAKLFCTMRLRESVARGRELFGGNGMLLEHDIVRFWNDAEALYSYEGTREINTLIVGRAITGVGAFV